MPQIWNDKDTTRRQNFREPNAMDVSPVVPSSLHDGDGSIFVSVVSYRGRVWFVYILCFYHFFLCFLGGIVCDGCYESLFLWYQ